MNDLETPVEFQMIRGEIPITILIGLLIIGIALCTTALLLEPSAISAAIIGFGIAAVMIAIILGGMSLEGVVQITKVGITIVILWPRATYTWDRILAIEPFKPPVVIGPSDRILKIRLKRKLPSIIDSVLVRVEQPEALVAAAQPYLRR